MKPSVEVPAGSRTKGGTMTQDEYQEKHKDILTCPKCRFYEKFPIAGSTDGQCRWGPPTANNANPYSNAVFPIVYEDDYCFRGETLDE